MTSHEEFYLDELPQSSKEILSVSDLNQLAKILLEENFSKVIVEGEISNKYSDALTLMKKKGSEMGLKPNENKL